MKRTALSQAIASFLIALTLVLLGYSAASALVYDMTVRGTDAIFLAGRTDVTIPDANAPWMTLLRHSYNSNPNGFENYQETTPGFVTVRSGDTIRLAIPAVGAVDFFNGFSGADFGPGGNGFNSVLYSLGGISGYKGPQGALTGVFLNDAIPSGGPAPATLDFSSAAMVDFMTLSPLLGQIFYIGDGFKSGGVAQQFITPAGATRLFLGIPDGWSFNGYPGYYDDNDGSYRVSLMVPDNNPVPEPATMFLFGCGLLGLAWVARRKKKQA